MMTDMRAANRQFGLMFPFMGRRFSMGSIVMGRESGI